MKSFTETDLLTALRDCFIPGARRDIVAAALLRSATLDMDTEAPGANVAGVPARYIARIQLTAPGTDEAVNAQLCALIENRLLGLEAISEAVVTLHPPLFSILS